MDPFEPTRLRLRISDLDRQIDELFSSFVNWPQKGAIGAEKWKPAIDAYENDDAYLFVADLPGVRAEDLTVRVEADGVAICGTRTSAERVQSGRRLSVERRYGEFCRRFPLAEPVTADAIQVTQEQGVFYIRVPKRPRV
jgi:HSP20 family protein